MSESAASNATRLPIARLVAEGLVIVASVIVALAADAWWDGRIDYRATTQNLIALQRDLRQAAERADSSLIHAEMGRESAFHLIAHVGLPPDEHPTDTALFHIAQATGFEVFSPARGAYDALLGTGQMELINDERIKHELASYYGSFDDLRVSEEALLASVRRFDGRLGDELDAGLFIPLVRSRPPTRERGALGKALFTQFLDSSALVMDVFHLALYQAALVEDYEFALQRLNELSLLIGEELAAR